jgi:Tol biopolymer transport system component/predicted Ser/Thr protein kinase
MRQQRWQQIEQLYHLVLEHEEVERAAFLQQACAGDEMLLREVQSLLACEQHVQSFMEAPALDVAAKVMAEDQAHALLGRQLGAYQVISLLGVGGMGEVYLAQDTKLDRLDALKILPAELASDPDRLQRFIREAKAASALRHPNVATIYEIGESDGVHFIAMEYVEGQTLAAEIRGRLLDAAEVVEIGIQVADALEEAHARGITHRDIKPANIMMTPRGQVKVLDFGLAKVTEPGGQAAASDLSKLAKTGTGIVLGTVRYMSPEQTRGLKLDARTDLFSLGVVLYEMVAGRPPFEGETSSDVLVAILERQPESLARRPDVPAELERIIRKALEKDREVRYQHASELRADLKRLKRDMDLGRLTAAAMTRGGHRRSLIWVAVLLALLAVAAGTVWFSRSHSEAPDEPLAAVPLTSYPGYEGQPSFSPDGNQVAFVWDGEKQDNRDIYVKLIGSERLLQLTTDPAADYSPAWSPDGRWIAFLRDLSAQKAAVLLVPALGGAGRKLAEIEPLSWFGPFSGPGLAWSPDGKGLVLRDRNSAGQGLFLLSVETGERQRLTSPPANLSDQNPAVAPDGYTLAFIRANNSGFGDIYLQKLSETLTPNGDPKRLTFDDRATYGPAWTADGREIVFASGRLGDMSLWRMAVSGSGKLRRLASLGEDYYEPAIARQGRRLAFTRYLFDANIWRVGVLGTQRKTSPPVSFISSTRLDANPQFSPDGKRIAFASGRSSRRGYEIWVCNSDGSNAVQLTSLGAESGTPRWSPDGERIAFDSSVEGQWEVYVVSANGGKPQRLTTNPAHDASPSWSRDGKWIYFGSNRTGENQNQIWKMPSNSGEAVQVTRKGGYSGFESPDGKFLYYSKAFNATSLWKVPVQGGEETQVVDSLSYYANFAVVNKGIYWIPRPDSAGGGAIEFLDLATGKIKPVARLEKPGRPGGLGLTVSPDGRWILYSPFDQEGSDIMLVENFR